MKRRILSLLLVLVLVMSAFTACGKQTANNGESNVTDNSGDNNNAEDNGGEDDPVEEAVSYLSLRRTSDGESEYEDLGETYECRIRCSYTMLELQDEDATLYPELSRALKALNEEIKEGVIIEYADYDQWSKDAIANDEPVYFPYYVDRDMLVRRADSLVLSLSIPYSNYSGGAHGWSGDFPRSFDSKTGKEIKFNDIVKDIDKMYDYITERLEDKYSEEWDMFIQFDTDSDPYELYKSGDATQNFYFGNEGITVIFNPYDLAAYAAGSQQVYIPYKGNEDLFVDGRYFEDHMDNYAITIQPGETYCGDIFGDGTEGSFSVCASVNSDDYDYVENMYFNVNGESYELSAAFYAFSQNAYLIRNDKGDVYCYFVTSEFNDYRIVYVYKVEKTGVQPVDAGSFGIWAPAPSGDDWWAWGGIITDPDNFYIDYRTDVLGTTHIHTLAKIGDDGMPEEYESIYEFGNRFELTLLREITVDTVSEAGDKTGTLTLKAGDIVRAYRTNEKPYRENSEVYVDLLTKDGTIIRINVTNEYPFEVDGIPMDELFDGIMYAG